MSSVPVLVIAHPREVALWEDALRARGLEPARTDRKDARAAANRQAPAVVVVTDKLPFGGWIRAVRDLRREPATRDAPVVLVGVRPFTTMQRIRLGTSAPDATVEPGASPEAVAAAVDEARRKGKLPPLELSAAQQAGVKYGRLANMLMVLGMIFAMPMGKGMGEGGHRGWFLVLIPLGGLVADVANGRVDGRKQLLSWQGWTAIVLGVAIALGVLFFPNFFLFR